MLGDAKKGLEACFEMEEKMLEWKSRGGEDDGAT